MKFTNKLYKLLPIVFLFVAFSCKQNKFTKNNEKQPQAVAETTGQRKLTQAKKKMPNKTKFYAKKYSELFIADLILGHTCKNILGLGIPVCFLVDATQTAAISFYEQKQYEKKVKTLQQLNETIPEPKYTFNEFLIDLGMFAFIMTIL